jgi:hypothetical protein
VSVQVKDSDNALSNIASQTVTVDNVKPTVALSGAASANEGDTNVYTYTVSDPGADTVSVTEGCGANGVYVADGVLNSFKCTFPDGDASSTVLVTANDEDPGPATEDSITVAVANVKPSIALSGSATANEGDTKTYSFSVSDPGQDDRTV